MTFVEIEHFTPAQAEAADAALREGNCPDCQLPITPREGAPGSLECIPCDTLWTPRALLMPDTPGWHRGQRWESILAAHGQRTRPPTAQELNTVLLAAFGGRAPVVVEPPIMAFQPTEEDVARIEAAGMLTFNPPGRLNLDAFRDAVR
jgi:hypothetical protein